MAKKDAMEDFDWEEVKDLGRLFENGYYDVEVIEVEVGETKKGNLRYTAQCEITAPAECKGQIFFQHFYVGTDDDPEGTDPETLRQSYGIQQLKDFAKKCRAKLAGSPEDVLKKCKGKSLTLNLTIEIQKKGEYAGQPAQRCRFFELGERKAEILGGSATEGGGRKKREAEEETTTRRPVRTSKKEEEEEEVEEEEEEEEEERPARKAGRR